MSSLLLGSRVALASPSSPLQLQWRRQHRQQQQRRNLSRQEIEEGQGAAAQRGYGSVEDGNVEGETGGDNGNALDNSNDSNEDEDDEASQDNDGPRISSLVSRLQWIFVLLVLPMIPLYGGVAYFGTEMMWWAARVTLWQPVQDEGDENDLDKVCRTAATPLVTYAVVSLIVMIYSAYHLLHMIQPTNQASAAAAAATLGGGIWRLPENSVRLNDYLVFQIYYLYLSIGADIVDTTTTTVPTSSTTTAAGSEGTASSHTSLDGSSNNSGGSSTLCWDQSRHGGGSSSGSPAATSRSNPTSTVTDPSPNLMDSKTGKNDNSTGITTPPHATATNDTSHVAVTMCDSTCPQGSPSHALFVAMRNYVNTLRPFSVTACICMVLLMPLVYYRMVQSIRYRHQQQQMQRRRRRRRAGGRRRSHQRGQRRQRRQMARHSFWTLGGDAAAGLHDDDDDDEGDDEWEDPNTVNAVLNRMDQIEFRNVPSTDEGERQTPAAHDLVREIVTVSGRREGDEEDDDNDHGNDDDETEQAEQDDPQVDSYQHGSMENPKQSTKSPQLHDKDEVPTCCICLVEFDFTDDKTLADLSRSNSGSSDTKSGSLFGEELVPLVSSLEESSHSRRTTPREEHVIEIEEEVDVPEDEEGGETTHAQALAHRQGETPAANTSDSPDVDLEVGNTRLEEEQAQPLASNSSSSNNGAVDTQDNNNNNDDDDGGDAVVRTECGHYFHRACIETWIAGTTSRFWDSSNRRRRRFRPPRRLACPLCKSDLSGGTALGTSSRRSTRSPPEFDAEEQIRQTEFLPRLPFPLRWFFRGLFVAWLFWWRGFGFSSD